MSRPRALPRDTHFIVADTMATFLSTLISLRLMDRLTVVPLIGYALAGTSLTAGLKHLFGQDDFIDVSMQSALVYWNHDGAASGAALKTVWAAPVCYVSKVFSHAFVRAGLKESTADAPR